MLKVNWMDFLTIGTLYQVSQQNAAIVERFGKFNKVGSAGINFKMPFIDQVVAVQNLRIQQLDVKVGTKTKDNVFLDILASVQFRVKAEDDSIRDSYYKLENVKEQIISYVFDVVKAEIPKMKLDDVFEKNAEVAVAIKNDLTLSLKDFGYEIIKALVTDINVDERIVKSMNEIVASEREKEAAIQKGEMEKIMIVKKAEAEAESKKLQGVGIAEQRKAIMRGFQESVTEFKIETGLNDATQVMTMVLMTQYFDALKDVAQSESNTILIPHSPGALGDISSQIRDSIAVGNMMHKN